MVVDPNTFNSVFPSGVVYGGSVFVAWYAYDNTDGTYTTKIASSFDGINWTLRYTNADLRMIALVRGTNEFVGIGTNSINPSQTITITSSAGTSWSSNVASSTRPPSNIRYNSSYGYVVTTSSNFSGGSAPILISSNGTSWSQTGVLGTYGGDLIADMVSNNSSTYIARMRGTNNNDIAQGTGNPPSLTFVSNVQNWTYNDIGGNTADGTNIFAYINTLFFVTVVNDVGVSAGTYVATNPTSWTKISNNAYNTWVYGASKYYLSDGFTSIYSTDGGVTWLNGINSVANGIIAYNGTICVCTNGNIGTFV